MSTKLPDSLPAVIHRSALMRDGGFAIYERIADDKIRKLLLAEALTSACLATEGVVPASDREEVRGGRPARRFLNAPGGSAQEAVYNAPWLLSFLRDLTSPTLVPTGPLGTYSY